MKAKNTDKTSLETKGQSTLISQLASNRNSFWCQSLKIRITVFTLILFVSSLFTIIFYANKLMREEIQRFSATQHLLSISYPSTHSLQQHLILAALFFSLFGAILIWWFIKQQLAPLELVCRELLSKQMASGHRPFIKDDISEFILGYNNRLDNLLKSEAVLNENHFRAKYAIEGTGDGLWDWNLEDNTVFFSTRWKKMLGYSEDEVGNGIHEWESRIHPEDKPNVLEDVQDYLEGNKPSYNNEHRVRCKDGSYMWILDRGMVVDRSPDGKPLRMIGTHIDISQSKQTENDLLEQKRFRLYVIHSG